MKKILLLAFLWGSCTLFAQDKSFSKTGYTPYHEMPNPAKTPVADWMKLTTDVNVSFADDNTRYAKEQVPSVTSNEWKASSWRGEKIHTQILVWTKKEIPAVTVNISDLANEKGNRIKSTDITAGFVRYVMTDEFGGGCDDRSKSKYDSSLVEDPIDITDKIKVHANTVQPIWLTVQVPVDAPAGKYSGSVTVNAIKKYVLKISIDVSKHQLPPPSEWKFDLDLWQSPNPIAIVHDVKLWSDEHFNLMRPYFKMLGDAGQKVITANIINQPWGRDHTWYEESTLIDWTKKKDGSWSFDFRVFDRYIEMMMSCGIKARINCYSMVTWNLTYMYFDEASGETKSITATPGTKEFNDFWTPMLRGFTRHLKDKGWFGITAIAMDERNMESMKAVFALLKQIDPAWKTSLAGNYHPEIAMDIFDYCIIIHDKFDPDVLSARKEAGKPSTYYTACGEHRPNGFTFSPPAENVWISWYAAAEGFTGYLRWAYNNWTESTLTDTRYRTWPAGDCYQIYPGPRTSIRFEKLIEGIQDFEKIRILKEQFQKEGKNDDLRKLNDALAPFTEKNLETIPAKDMVSKGIAIINGF